MSHFAITDKVMLSPNGTDDEAQRNGTYTAPQIDDDWEKMYLDDGDKELCQNIASHISHPPSDDEEGLFFDNNHHGLNEITVNRVNHHIDDEFEDHQFDDEFLEWEKTCLRDNEENQLYIPSSEITDDWEKMYQDDEVDQNDFHYDCDSNCSSTFNQSGLLNIENLEEINRNFGNDAYLEDDEEGESQVPDVRASVNVPVKQDSPLLQSEDELSGRRIVNIGYLFKQIQAAGRHSDNCHFEDMILQHEIKSGLTSSFIFRCGVCGTMTRVETDQKKKSSLGINREAVLGISSVGLGFSHLEEFCANIDVPSMSYNLFRKVEKVQQEDWYKLAKTEALKALEEEIKLAKANGEVDSKGNALIRIITDGSWGKRSYGRFFSSLSGCAVIVGLRTNKVIYFDVRNKYCHTCKLAEGKNLTVKEHKCNKNYTGPSSGMESDIIINGFKECEVLGARFNVLISDGDSNTYKMIRDLRIYKDPDVFVAKFECVNHLYRNFYKKFNNLGSITKFNSESRKRFITKSICLDLCKGIRMASNYWRETNETLSNKIRMLERDILNAPAHYLGHHEQCSSYFCKKTTEPGASENIKLLKEDGLYYEIQSICQTYFGNNAKSLLANYTNNPAEQLNSYVAKYLGGKRINYSLAGSYTARVAMAVVHFNSGCQANSEYRKMKLGSVENTSKIVKLELKRKRKCQQNAVARAKKPRVRRSEPEQGKGYGGDYSEDLEHGALEAAKNIVMEKLIRNQAKRKSIETMTKESEHYNCEIIRNMLMAYYFSSIINAKGPKSYTKILDEVMYTQSQLGNNAQNKHQRVQELEALETLKRVLPNSSLQECGVFIDEELPYLGASPYRLYGSDYIISIKCPLKSYKKNIDEAALPIWKTQSGKRIINQKSAWYLEIQGELHVTKRKLAYLMIWLGPGENQQQVIQIKREDIFFQNEMKEKLVFFFREAMLKELANPRKGREMNLREYDETSKTFL